MGRVNKLIISKDDKCRTAEEVIITNGKQLKLERPVNKLYPIESSVSSAVVDHSFKNKPSESQYTYVTQHGKYTKKLM